MATHQYAGTTLHLESTRHTVTMMLCLACGREFAKGAHIEEQLYNLSGGDADTYLRLANTHIHDILSAGDAEAYLSMANTRIHDVLKSPVDMHHLDVVQCYARPSGGLEVPEVPDPAIVTPASSPSPPSPPFPSSSPPSVAALWPNWGNIQPGVASHTTPATAPAPSPATATATATATAFTPFLLKEDEVHDAPEQTYQGCFSFAFPPSGCPTVMHTETLRSGVTITYPRLP
jgi:hypothetical protein